MFKFTMILGVFLVTQIGHAQESVNPFRGFLGNYTITSRMCQPTDAACKDLREVALVENFTMWDRIIALNETLPSGLRGFKLVEFDEKDAFGNRSYAQHEGDGIHVASQTTYIDRGADVGTNVETRTFLRVGDRIQYSYRFQLIKNADGNSVDIERHYNLEKQWNGRD